MKTGENRNFSRTSSSVIRHKKMTGRRVWLFGVIAVFVIPALFPIFLEIGLPILGFAHPTHFTVECQVNGRTPSRRNDKFNRLFSPPGLARASIPSTILAGRPQGTFRMIVLGCPAVQDDSEHTFAMARILPAMLNDRYSEGHPEVIMASGIATKAHHENLIKVFKMQETLDKAINTPPQASGIMLANGEEGAAEKSLSNQLAMEIRRLQNRGDRLKSVTAFLDNRVSL